MVSIPGHIIRGTLTLGLLKGVDDLYESNILFVNFLKIRLIKKEVEGT
jgi:energy-converting hydrogenase Eha subunit F